MCSTLIVTHRAIRNVKENTRIGRMNFLTKEAKFSQQCATVHRSLL